MRRGWRRRAGSALGSTRPRAGGPRSRRSWIGGRRSTARTTRSTRSRSAVRDAFLIDFEIPTGTACGRRSPTRSGSAASRAGSARCPVMIDIGNDMADVCPDATLLNFTNPMAMVPWAVYEGSRFDRVVGLCHSRLLHARVPRRDGRRARWTRSRSRRRASTTRRSSRGSSATARICTRALDAAIEADPEGLGRRVRVELYKELGYFPTESSEHSAEYVSWFMRHDDQIERFRIPVDDYIGRTEEALAEYREIVRKLEAGEPVGADRGASSPPTSSTRSRPARRARSTRT